MNRDQGSGIRGQRPGGGGRGTGFRVQSSGGATGFLIPNPQSLTPRRSGFTLVELLVVVAIIGMLVGLLLPAVLAARGRARVAQCMNNQKQLALAIMHYEGAKQPNKLPGYANSVGTGVPNKLSWVAVLLPFLDRMDLWEGPGGGVKGWRTGQPAPAIQNTRIDEFACPDDSNTSNYPLSYVVSVGTAGTSVPDDTTDASQNSVFRNLCNCPTKTVTLASIKSSSRRPMISERTYTLESTPLANRQWSDIGANVNAQRLGFVWPNPPTATDVVGQLTPAPGVLPPIHPGIVIVTFCDGHTESLADNAQCNAYDYLAIQ